VLEKTTEAERNALTAHNRMRRDGRPPAGLLPGPIEASWRRCLESGPGVDLRPEYDPGRRDTLDLMRHRNKALVDHALPIMETLYEQIANTQSMVVLSDAAGYILHSLGDDDFLARAERVALSPGVEWSECTRGTNAIGTALAEQAPVVVHAAQHFLPANHFLTCSAAPLHDPYGRIVGVLDVTGDHRRFSPHTLALANMSVKMIENHLFCHAFQHALVVRLHARPEFLGTLCEGLAAFSEGGELLSVNPSGSFQFGLAQGASGNRRFEDLFGLPLAVAHDFAARAAPAPCPLLLHNGIRVYVRIEAAPRKFRPAPEAPPVDEAREDADRRADTLVPTARLAVSGGVPLLIEYDDVAAGASLARCFRRQIGGDAACIEFDCARLSDGAYEAFLGALACRTPQDGARVPEVVFLWNVHELNSAGQARLVSALQAALPPQGRNLPFALISSSHGRLKTHVGRRAFRDDLAYRLCGRIVALPGRERYCEADGTDLDSITRQAIEAALDAAAGNVSAAARRLGISRSTLYRRLKGT